MAASMSLANQRCCVTFIVIFSLIVLRAGEDGCPAISLKIPR